MVDPMIVNFRALWPCPLSNSSWPGRIERLVSSDGAPRKMEGMKSMNVWVIAIDIMKIRRGVIGMFWMNVMERRDIATRLIWIPGIRPVKIPVMLPKIKGIKRLSIKVEREGVIGFYFGFGIS